MLYFKPLGIPKSFVYSMKEDDFLRNFDLDTIKIGVDSKKLWTHKQK